MLREPWAARPHAHGATKDYSMDWSEWLEDLTITEASVTSSDPAFVVSDDDHTDKVVRWRLGGGVAGSYYKVTVSVTASNGQTDLRSVRFRVYDA